MPRPARNDDHSMRCPTCGAPTEVKDTRPLSAGATIRRRRLCANGHRFTTHEALPKAGDALQRALIRAANRLSCVVTELREDAS